MTGALSGMCHDCSLEHDALVDVQRIAVAITQRSTVFSRCTYFAGCHHTLLCPRHALPVSYAVL